METDATASASPSDIFAESLRDGVRRLTRPWGDLLATGFLGALAIAIGALSADVMSGFLHGSGLGMEAAKAIGALFFPLGFAYLIQIKAELFTENFLVPVNAVLDGLVKGRYLLRLWGGAMVANVVGAVFIARLATVPGVLPPTMSATFVRIAEDKVTQPSIQAVLVSGLLGGFLITLMTLAVLRGGLGAWFAVFASGFLINVGTLQHCIVNTIDAWLGIFSGAHISVWDWIFRNFLPVAAANLVGGVGLATLPHYLQVFHQHSDVLQDVREEVGIVPAKRRL